MSLGPPPARPVSGLERVWLAADRLLPPFVIQLVLEGEGRLSADRVEAALEVVAAALPGTRLRARGWLRGMRWLHDGPLPRVREVAVPGWDGQSEAGAPFLADPLSPAGPVAEVVLAGQRVVLRALHAAMDGRGLLLLAEALFTALRGEAVAPAVGAELADFQVVQAAPRPPPPRDATPACPLGAGPGTTWRRARIDGQVPALLPRVVAALAPGRIDVPVDLRRHRPDLRSTANLTGLVRLEVDAQSDVGAMLDAALAARDEAVFVAQGEQVRGLPLWLLTWAGRRAAAAGRRSGRVTTSATVTNLGRLDLATLRGGGWTTRRAFVLPPGSPDLPVLLALTGDAAGVELCAVCPVGGQPQAVLDRVLTALHAGRDPEK